MRRLSIAALILLGLFLMASTFANSNRLEAANGRLEKANNKIIGLVEERNTERTQFIAEANDLRDDIRTLIGQLRAAGIEPEVSIVPNPYYPGVTRPDSRATTSTTGAPGPAGPPGSAGPAGPAGPPGSTPTTTTTPPIVTVPAPPGSPPLVRLCIRRICVI